VRQEVRNLTIMGMQPNQSADQLALIRNLERSARAELRLRWLALEYWKRQAQSSAKVRVFDDTGRVPDNGRKLT